MIHFSWLGVPIRRRSPLNCVKVPDVVCNVMSKEKVGDQQELHLPDCTELNKRLRTLWGGSPLRRVQVGRGWLRRCCYLERDHTGDAKAEREEVGSRSACITFHKGPGRNWSCKPETVEVGRRRGFPPEDKNHEEYSKGTSVPTARINDLNHAQHH